MVLNSQAKSSIVRFPKLLQIQIATAYFKLNQGQVRQQFLFYPYWIRSNSKKMEIFFLKVASL